MTRYRLSWSDFNWKTGGFIIGYHAALLVILPLYFYYGQPQISMIVASLVLLFLTEIGVGAAYHRFYSHRCYKLGKPAESVLLFLATMATQGSALQWSHDHRLHHAFVDTDDDPYSIHKGFWYAHVLWLFEPDKPIDEKRVADLLRNPLVRLQHRHANLLSMASNLLVCGLLGLLLGDLLGAFILAWWTRLLLSHHLTWFVNSLAHYWGDQTYSREHSAVDNYILAFLTVGEGYHNFHHTFPSDYRNGVRWYHFDPTKWTIWALSKLGLAGGLKRYSRYSIENQLLREDRKLLLGRISRGTQAATADLERRINALADLLQEKLHRLGALAERLQRLKRDRRHRTAFRETRRELKRLRRSMRSHWRQWQQLCALVLRQRSVQAARLLA